MMRSKLATRCLGLGVLALITCEANGFAAATWFNQRVTWNYGKEGLEWKTIIRDPHGQRGYLLALRPLWAVKGGVVAMEIVVRRPAQPEVNLLGEKQKGVEYPFVITVQDLQQGVAKSRFGAVRNFQVENVELRVRIEGFRLGRGVGSGSTFCKECKNIQTLSARISVESRAD